MTREERGEQLFAFLSSPFLVSVIEEVLQKNNDKHTGYEQLLEQMFVSDKPYCFKIQKRYLYMSSDGGGGFDYFIRYIGIDGVVTNTPSTAMAEEDWYLIPSKTYNSTTPDFKRMEEIHQRVKRYLGE